MTEQFNRGLQLSVLRSEQVERVHSASLRILEEVGVRVDASSAVELLREAGARFVNEARCILPPAVVDRAIASAAGAFPVFDRSGRLAFTCGNGPARFGLGVTNLYYEDPASGQIGPFTRNHMSASVRLAQKLPQYELVSTVGVLRDMPIEQADLFATLELAANTTKPLILLVSDPAQFVPCLDLLEALAGNLSERPFVLPYVNPITPLVLNAETTDKMTAAIERGLPIIFSNYGMAGATTPITPLRTLALLNAELLAGLVFSQAVRPGARVVLGSLPAYFDMRTMVDFYDPRSILVSAACAEMMAHYGIPHAGTSGSGNGWGPDVLAAGELWLNHLTACTGCSGLVPFVGGNLGSKVFSPAAAVLGAEIIAQARAFAAGFDWGEMDGLFEEVVTTGPGGTFLQSPHTLQLFRVAYQSSRLFPHFGLEQWQEFGEPSADARLRAAAAELVANARPPEDHDELLRRGEALVGALTS